jgi:hypothetical protein
VARSKQVITWLKAYSGPKWWNGPTYSLPSQQDMVAWLLYQEGSTLRFNDDLKFMGRIMRYRLRNDGLTAANLAGFTAFFNPNGGLAFDAQDWEELVLLPGIDLTRYKRISQEVYTMGNYQPPAVNGQAVVFWWTDAEAPFTGDNYYRIADYHKSGEEDFGSLYFGNYAQCQASGHIGCQ